MFCRNCGKQLEPAVRFCPGCGTKVNSEPDTSERQNTAHETASGAQARWGNGTPSSQLLRPRSPRMLGGVCAAFAIHFGWNLAAVRIVTVILGVFHGLGVLAYLACWIIIPEAQYALPSQSR